MQIARCTKLEYNKDKINFGKQIALAFSWITLSVVKPERHCEDIRNAKWLIPQIEILSIQSQYKYNQKAVTRMQTNAWQTIFKAFMPKSNNPELHEPTTSISRLVHID